MEPAKGPSVEYCSLQRAAFRFFKALPPGSILVFCSVDENAQHLVRDSPGRELLVLGDLGVVLRGVWAAVVLAQYRGSRRKLTQKPLHLDGVPKRDPRMSLTWSQRSLNQVPPSELLSTIAAAAVFQDSRRGWDSGVSEQ